jgi:GDSL-like Lipase/Acylhydrolase family
LADLAGAGLSFEVVGPNQNVPRAGGDADHAGYGGATLGPDNTGNNLASRVSNLMATYQPDYVVVLAGVNTLWGNGSGAAAADTEYTQLISSIMSARPTAWVISCATPKVSGQSGSTPFGGTYWEDLYNAASSAAVSSASDKLVFADVGAIGFTVGDFYDSTHWTQAGADKVGTVIANAIKEIENPTSPPPPPTRGLRQSKHIPSGDWGDLEAAGDITVSFDAPVQQGNAVVLCAVAWNDLAGTGTGGSTGTHATTLINAMEPQANGVRVLYGPNDAYSAGWPEFSTIHNYTDQLWPPDMFWEGRETDIVFWGVVWEARGNLAWGAPYTENPANKKVVPHVRNFTAFVYYSDTNQWERVMDPGPLGWEAVFPGQNGPENIPADPANYQTFSDGSVGYTPWNATGVDDPEKSQMWHFSAYADHYIRDARKQYVVCIASFYECRVEPHVVRGGTTADCDASTYTAHSGMDPYPHDWSGYSSRLNAKLQLMAPDDLAGIAVGRTAYLTKDWQTFGSYAMSGPGGGSTAGTKSWMQAHPIPAALAGDTTGQTTANLIVAGCTDNQSNGSYYTVANVEATGGVDTNVFASMHYMDNVRSNGGTFSVNVDYAQATHNVASLILLEVAGTQTLPGGSLDKVATASVGAGSMSISATTSQLSQPDEFLIGVTVSVDPPEVVYSGPPGFSVAQYALAPVTGQVATKLVSSTAPVTATWGFSEAHASAAILASFRLNPTSISSGAANITLPTPATVAAGKVTVRGSLAKVLASATVVATSGALAVGNLNKTLQNLSAYATGRLPIVGDLSQTLQAASSYGSTVSSLFGQANIFLTSLLGVSEGELLIRGNSTKTLSNATSNSVGAVSSPSVYVPPVADVVTSGWGSTDPGALFEAVNETQPNDFDYVYATNQNPVEFQLQPVDDPYQSTGHTIQYRVRSQYGHGVIVALLQGSVVIAQWTHPTLTYDFTTYVQALTSEQADAITNYADLRIRIYAL